jgi:hypothetical protein
MTRQKSLFIVPHNINIKPIAAARLTTMLHSLSPQPGDF